MKKLLGFCMFVMVALGPSVVQGQGGTLRSSTAANGFSNIVRYCSSRGSYVNASMNPMGVGFQFSLTDLAQLIDAQFPNDNYVVLDMELLDEMVFFCGFDRVLNSGLLGWFNIEGLFYDNEPIHIDTVGLIRLENIEVFRGEEDEIHVVGYGVHSEGWVIPDVSLPDWVCLYKAFEAVGDPTCNNMQYRVAEMYSGGLNSDYRDVKVTDDFVVFMQCSGNQQCRHEIGIGVDLVVFPKNDMLSVPYCSLQQFQTIDDYMIYGPGCTYVFWANTDPFNTNAKMVSIGENRLAVCTHRIDLSPDTSGLTNCNDCLSIFHNNSFLTHRIYDVSPLLMNNPAMIVSAIEAKLPSTYSHVGVVKGLVYDMDKYAVLHDFERGSSYESAVTVFDFTSGTPATVTSSYQTLPISGWRTEGLCSDGATSYLVSGFESSTINHFFKKTPFVDEGVNCSVLDIFDITDLNIIEAKNNTWGVDASNWFPLIFEDHYPSVNQEELQIICE